MHFSLLLGAVCLVSSAAAQQYISAGPVPPVFPGAQLVRPQIRQRTISRGLEQQPALPSRTPAGTQDAQQVIRQRRPVARSRNLVQEEKPAPRISTGNIEDAYRTQRISPTPIPTQATLPQTSRLVTTKPVVEEEEEYIEEEEDDETTTPASISRSSYVGPFQPNQAPTPFQRPLVPQQQPAQPQTFQRPAFLQPSAFRPSAQVTIQQQQLQLLPSPEPAILRQFPRPQQSLRPAQPAATPVTRPTPTSSQSQASSEEDEAPQYYRQPARQPQRRPQQQQTEPESYKQSQPNKSLQSDRQQIIRQPETRPYPSKASTAQREKKPVVQTVRKYHEENEDGSITWGYENDDGTFKEETIGNDCVTHGKYGYYDPDGVKREYTYQTGIPCDKEAEAEQAASNNNEGYVDYTSNTYVLPNGEEIDLDAMVKNRARKPVGKYRN